MGRSELALSGASSAKGKNVLHGGGGGKTWEGQRPKGHPFVRHSETACLRGDTNVGQSNRVNRRKFGDGPTEKGVRRCSGLRRKSSSSKGGKGGLVFHKQKHVR